MKIAAQCLDDDGAPLDSIEFILDGIGGDAYYFGKRIALDLFLEMVGPIGSTIPAADEIGAWRLRYDAILAAEIAAGYVPKYDRYADQEYDGLEVLEL